MNTRTKRWTNHIFKKRYNILINLFWINVKNEIIILTNLLELYIDAKKHPIPFLDYHKINTKQG